jgi:hypothetical protein
MKYSNVFTVIFTPIFLLSCGLESNYYLPQVSQGRVTRISNSEATITLPPIDQYSYALNYIIFYKIYISGDDISYDIQTQSDRNQISSDLSRDYDIIYPNTDPVSTTSSNAGIFTNRSFFELELANREIKNILPKTGGAVRIRFPTGSGEYPTISLNGGSEIRLRRSSELISPQPVGDMSFRNTDELSDPEKSISNINADVSSRSGLSQRFAYASMYIVAVGLTVDFKQIYSKPTHISIFRLPNKN